MLAAKIKVGDAIEYVTRRQGAAERRVPPQPAPITEIVWPAVVVRVRLNDVLDVYVTPNSADEHGNVPPGFDVTNLKPDAGQVGGDGWRRPVLKVGNRVGIITRYATGSGISETIAPAQVERVHADGTIDAAVTTPDGGTFKASAIAPEPEVSSITREAVILAGYPFRQSFRRVA